MVINLAKQPFACGECHQILDDSDGPAQCSRCPSAPVSTDWQGYTIILDCDRSEVAKRLGITVPGKYALKVNIR